MKFTAKKHTQCRLFSGLTLFILFLISPMILVRAQSGSRLAVSPMDLNRFPEVQFQLEMYDERGNFIADLQKEQVKVNENGSLLELQTLEREEPGIQLILAYNPSSAFATPAPGGNYFSYIQKTLFVWAQNQAGADQPNSLSVTTANGLYAVQITNAGEWNQILQSYQPDLVNSQANLISLSVALDLATDPTLKPDMKSVIFYITSVLPANMTEALPNQISRAVQAGVPVFVWLVAPGATDSPEVDSLHHLASDSGGSLYVISTHEEVPGLDAFIQPMRYIYQASYLSDITQTGNYSVTVEVERQGVALSSEPVHFALSLQPPTPIFLSPPVVIQRSYQEDADNQKKLMPETVPIQFVLEFPDKRPRELKEARLYMDGLLAVQNIQPPFNQFNLPLKAIEGNRTIQLQIEVTDQLGLTQRSLQIPVKVEVDASGGSIWKQPAKLLKFFGGVAVLLFISALIYFGFRLRKQFFSGGPSGGIEILQTYGTSTKAQLNRNTAARMGSKPVRALARNQTLTLPRTAAKRPITLPAVQKEKKPTDALAGRISQPAVQSESVEPAHLSRLIPLPADGMAQMDGAIELNRREVTVGNNNRTANIYVDSPGLNAVHARLRCSEEGEWAVYDANTIAGTYVNFNPIDSGGKVLRHGDVIQFGTAAYRFELANPVEIPRPIVSSGVGDSAGSEPVG